MHTLPCSLSIPSTSRWKTAWPSGSIGFRASVYPDETKIKLEGGAIAFGLLDFSQALVRATEDFLEALEGPAEKHIEDLEDHYAEIDRYLAREAVKA